MYFFFCILCYAFHKSIFWIKEDSFYTDSVFLTSGHVGVRFFFSLRFLIIMVFYAFSAPVLFYIKD